MLDLNSQNELKIIDFGFASNFNESKLTGACGTLNYVAPEVLSEQPYTEMCDMWCVGVMLYEFLSGNLPYPQGNRRETHKCASKGNYTLKGDEWNKISD